MTQRRVETGRSGRAVSLGKNDPRDRRYGSRQAPQTNVVRQDFAGLQAPSGSADIEELRQLLAQIVARLKGGQ